MFGFDMEFIFIGTQPNAEYTAIKESPNKEPANYISDDENEELNLENLPERLEIERKSQLRLINKLFTGIFKRMDSFHVHIPIICFIWLFTIRLDALRLYIESLRLL